MTKTMQLTLRVERMTSCRIVRLNCREALARTMAPTAPTAADSVAVAMPARIEPKTATIRVKGGTRTKSTRLASPRRSDPSISNGGADLGSL